MYICGCVCGCACGGVFLFLNFNFILYVNVRNDLRWLDRLKNEDIHQIYDVFENTIFKTLEHL